MTSVEILDRFEAALYADPDLTALAAMAMPYRHMVANQDSVVETINRIFEAWVKAHGLTFYPLEALQDV